MVSLKNLDRYGIQVKKKVHNGWKEWISAKKMTKLHPVLAFGENIFLDHPNGFFGKDHYIFKSAKGEISLIQLLDYHRMGEHIWEIFCPDKRSPAKRTLTEIRRFYKQADAVKCVIEILRTKNG